MYLNKRKSQKKLVLQKHRFKPKIFFTDKYMYLSQHKMYCFICIKQSIYLELKYFKFIIKKFRKLSKKKKFKVWVNFCCNHAWFKKSKNARMGKGKGKFVRFFFKATNCKPLIIFSRISKIRIIKFLKFLKHSGNFYYGFFNK